jgi:hypothetical protein
VTPDGYINRTAGQNVPLYSNPDVVASAVAWGDRVEGSARGILAEAEAIKDKDESKAAALREAKDFLLELLTDGPLPTKEVQVAARNAWTELAHYRARKSRSQNIDRQKGRWLAVVIATRSILPRKNSLATKPLAELADIAKVKQKQKVHVCQDVCQHKILGRDSWQS